MATSQIREELHEYIDSVDEKKLEAIYLVLKDNINSGYSYNPDELSEIYSRRNRFINGDEEVLTTEELVNFVHQNKL
jgi:hypothetical protein